MIGSQPIQYQNMLETILKKAQKAERPEVVTETIKALALIKNINKHANKYSADVVYVEAMENMKKEITDVKVANPLHEFGTKQFEIAEVDMRLLSDTNFKKFQLIVFKQYILAIELKFEDEGLNWIGQPIKAK